MPAPIITTAPPAPLRTEDPATFVTKAEAFVDWMAGAPDELNAFGDYLNGYTPGEGYAPGGTDVAVADGGTGASDAAGARSNLSVYSQAEVTALIASAVTGLLDFKGNQDCSANPNYPAASKGDCYIVSVAGKIGGASGASVDAGDVMFATADNAGGTQASVGSSWAIIEHNGVYGGSVSFATASDINTGTDTTKALNSDALAGSNFGKAVFQVWLSDLSTAITTGDGKAYLVIPAALNGMDLVAVKATLVVAQSTSGIPTVQIANVTDGVDMLSTKLTIDANETDSATAATAAVIDTTKDDVATGDILRFDIDVAGTGAKGLVVTVTFQLP